MFASAQFVVAALFATTPPIFEIETIFDESWDKAADAFRPCSAKAAAANRAGTVWIDVRFPEFIEPGYRSPIWTLRRSPGLLPADEACARAVVARKVLPGMAGAAVYSLGKTHTKELALGNITRYLPPLAGLLPLWREVARAPSEPAARARLVRQVRPLGGVDRDGCLTVHQEWRLQDARQHWLTAAAREAIMLWQPVVDRLGKAWHVKEPFAFVVDGDLLLAGVRFDKRAGRRHAPDDWSLRLETYCLRPLEPELVREVDRGIDEIATCVAGAGAERLVAPRLEPPQDRRLHSLTMVEDRTCGIDQAGAIVCCGFRAGTPPAGSFTAVSIGDRYACALRSNGEIACWGNPPLGATPPPGRFTTIAIGAWGNCAIAADRTIQCWGGIVDWHPPRGQFVDVDVGTPSQLAVGVDGTLVEWGRRESRRTGDATQVAANDCQSCVLNRGGAVECRDEKGKTSGLGGPLTFFAPLCAGGCGLRPNGTAACLGAVGPPPEIAQARFVEIASTHSRVCAVSADGQLTCWGTPWPGPWFGKRVISESKP
jgi:hypothetical protein